MMLKFKFHCKTAVGLNAKDFCYCPAWANVSNSYLACQKFTGPTQNQCNDINKKWIETCVINYSTSYRPKPLRPLFMFGTEIKIFDFFFFCEHKKHIPESQTCSKTHISYAACLHEGKELATEVLIFGEL